MAITVAQLHIHGEAARAALALSDFTTALSECRAALAVLALLPNTQVGEARVEWRESLSELIKVCERGQAQQVVQSAGGIQRTLINYIGPTE